MIIVHTPTGDVDVPFLHLVMCNPLLSTSHVRLMDFIILFQAPVFNAIFLKWSLALSLLIDWKWLFILGSKIGANINYSRGFCFW